MERNPPPLFRQGAPAFLKMVLFALVAIALLVADSRLHTLKPIRQFINTVLYPVQRIALLPRDAVIFTSNYFSSLTTVQEEIRSLQQQQLTNSQTLQQAQALTVENARLRKLLYASQHIKTKSVLAEILYNARAPFTRKVIIDRGGQEGIVAGQPAIDDNGVLGQVTRVFPLTAEVTLLTDKDQAIPVQVLRSGLRSVAHGRGQSNFLDLRYVLTDADIQTGDLLVTSGIDGVYPPGLAVAKVTRVKNSANSTFSQVTCQPVAGMNKYRQMLILLVDTNLPPRPLADDPGIGLRDKPTTRKRGRE